jgi:hypothetical protein
MADDTEDTIEPSPATVTSSREFDSKYSASHEAGWKSGFLDGAGYVLQRVLEDGSDDPFPLAIVDGIVRRFGADDVLAECRRRRLTRIIAWIEERRAEQASATTAVVTPPAPAVDDDPPDNGPTAVGGYEEASGWLRAQPQPQPKGPRSSR